MLQVRVKSDKSKVLKELQDACGKTGLFSSIKDATSKQVDSITKQQAYKLFNNIVRYTPVRTGNLRNSWHIQRVNNGYIIYNTAKYAEIVDKRTQFIRKAMNI